VKECPKCGGSVAHDAEVCRHCLHILDREGWGHDAGRLGADGRGGGREPEDPPVGPVPLSGSGLAGGVAGAASAGFRLLTTGLLLKRRGRRRDQSDA
jgi:hypothetical protein